MWVRIQKLQLNNSCHRNNYYKCQNYVKFVLQYLAGTNVNCSFFPDQIPNKLLIGWSWTFLNFIAERCGNFCRIWIVASESEHKSCRPYSCKSRETRPMQNIQVWPGDGRIFRASPTLLRFREDHPVCYLVASIKPLQTSTWNCCASCLPICILKKWKNRISGGKSIDPCWILNRASFSLKPKQLSLIDLILISSKWWKVSEVWSKNSKCLSPRKWTESAPMSQVDSD